MSAGAAGGYPLCSECQRPMRPRRVTLENAPGTVAYGNSKMCKSDAQPNTAEFRGRERKRSTGADASVQAAKAATGLEAWIARRHSRGVAPEPESPIRFRTEELDAA